MSMSGAIIKNSIAWAVRIRASRQNTATITTFWFTKHASETQRRNLHIYEMSPFKRKTKAYQAFKILIAQQFMSNKCAAVILTTVPVIRLSTHHWSSTSTRNLSAKTQLTLAVTYFRSRHKQSIQTADNRTTELQNELHLNPSNVKWHSERFLSRTKSLPSWYFQTGFLNRRSIIVLDNSQLNRRLMGSTTVFCPLEPETSFNILA